VDGQPDCTNTFTYTKNLASWDQVAIGALVRNNVGVPFLGSVDDVALWARALSQAEVQDVMTNSIATPVPAFRPVIAANPIGASSLLPGDNFTLSAAAYGTRPLSYQWTKNGSDVPEATSAKLALAGVSTADGGAYRLVVTNAAGSVTSLVAQVTVNDYAAPNLTNGIVAYWPLDTVAGTKTPDVVSAYDLTLFGSTAPSLVEGKWGNAMSFSSASSQYASRTHTAGESIPAYTRSNFTVSFWAKAPANAAGGWAFTESSSSSSFPAFCLGIKDGSALSPYVDSFLRDNSGNPSGLHTFPGPNMVWDDVWHNVVYVQHDVAGAPVAKVYVDGVADQTPATRYPITVNRTSLGAYVRGTANGFFNGLVDELVIWERPLSPEEIALLPTVFITNPPVRIQPLAINSFKADLPAVAQGDSTVLRWDVPANADSVSIDPIGSVTGQTVAGAGSTNVSPTTTTAYVLTVTRTTGILGTEIVKATNVVGVVAGVAANWSLLDNFDFYSPGFLAANGWWVDVGGGSSVAVETPATCNRLAKTVSSASGAYLKLNTLTVNPGQSRTLFFRMIPSGNFDVSALRHYVGITDRPGNFDYQYKGGNIGPAVQPTVNDATQNPGDWLLAAVDIPYSPLTFATNVFQTGEVYSVWIDVTNVFIGDRVFPDNYDLFSVFIQKEGDTERTAVFTNFTSDRDLFFDDPITGGMPTDPLTRIYLCGNSATYSALFDDFYLSKSGYNDTVPKSFGYTGMEPTLQLQWSGSQWQVIFQGKLQEAASVTGPWSDVSGAVSPHPVSTTGEMKFYRAVCN